MCGATGRVNVKQEEIDEMLKEAPGPINFTVFLTMFGEKLKGKNKLANDVHLFKNMTQLRKVLTVLMSPGADPEETILNAFKVFDPEAKGSLKKD